jgi:hypothetical protein
MDLTTNPKVKITEEEGVGACSLARSILGVERCVGTLGSRLGRLTINSITHMDLHKPDNKFVMRKWNNFGARMNHGRTRTHKTHHDLDSGKATTFPLIVYYVHGHEISTQMSFCLEISK